MYLLDQEYKAQSGQKVTQEDKNTDKIIKHKCIRSPYFLYFKVISLHFIGGPVDI